MTDIKIKLIEWVINEATDEQLDGLDELINYGDIMAGLEGLLGRGDAEDFIDEIKREAVEELED